MTNTPPQEDGRLGGFVPLNLNANDFLPAVAEPDFIPLPEFGEQGLQTDLGESVDANSLIVDGREDVVRLPLGNGESEIVRLDQLNQGQLTQLEAVLANSAPSGRLSTEGSPGTGVAADPAILSNIARNAFPANPLEPLQRAARNQLRVNEEQAAVAEQEEVARIGRFGLSHVENGVGSSIFDQRYDPGFEDNFVTSHEIEYVADAWFQTELQDLNRSSRALEREYRAAIFDIDSFLEAELGREFDLDDSTLRALTDTYKERLNVLQDSRAYYADTLRRQQQAVANGDYSALPPDIVLTDDQLDEIEFEGVQRKHTNEMMSELIETYGNSSSLPDRVTFELVRGYINGTYRGGDFLAADIGGNIQYRDPETGLSRLSARDQETVRQNFADFVGLNTDLTGVPKLRSAFISDAHAEYLDQWRFGIQENDTRKALGISQSIGIGRELNARISDASGDTAANPEDVSDPTDFGIRAFDIGAE